MASPVVGAREFGCAAYIRQQPGMNRKVDGALAADRRYGNVEGVTPPQIRPSQQM